MTWRDPTPQRSPSAGQTQPVRRRESIESLQPVPVRRERGNPIQHPGDRRESDLQPRRKRGGCACGCLGPVSILLLIALAAYLFVPSRTNLLVLGIDRAPEGTALGRSDTMILVSVSPLRSDVAMLSIPRDLWVNIPGEGENRINTAHYFAEIREEGSGPRAAAQVVEDNFAVPVDYTLRFRFDGFQAVVDAMGGVTLDLPEPMAGYPAGQVTLDGEHALAFVRDRQGTDDFFRMEHGQVFILGMTRQMLNPLNWLRAPAVLAAGMRVVDTDVPIWMWPRLGLAFLRAVLGGGIDNRTLDRSMVEPFTTAGGAQVLGPRWDVIQPVVAEMFGG